MVEVREIRGPEELVIADKIDHIAKRLLVGVARDPALAMKIVAGLFLERHRLTQRAVVDRVHAVEQIAGPARAGLQHDDLYLWEAVEQTVLKQGGKGLQRPLPAVHVEVPQRPLLHVVKALVDPLGRRLAAGMDADRHVQLLGLGPEGVIVGVGVGLVGRRERHHKRAPAAVLDRPFQLAGRLLGIAKGDVSNGNQPPGRIAAEVRHPAVVGSGIGGLESQIAQILGLPDQAQAGIHNRLVQPLGVHALQALLGVH